MAGNKLLLDDEIMTTPQVAERLNMPVPTLRYWRFMGTGPRSFVMGQRRVMYRRTDVEAWLTDQYQATAAR
ncbi:MAG: helix-turn-helix domain-containing protein [Propionibacteriaceae bacterium]|nr:helix-turn-helix domain-containing protein [Propionibacteriaceae bacterium]